MRKRSVFGLVVLLVLAGAAPAQIWLDAFNYPAGPNLGTWQKDRGKWTATGSMAKSEEIRAYQFLTQPNRLYKDCAVECFVQYNKSSTQKLQFGGLTIRCNAPKVGSFGGDLVMVKVQDNNSSGDFDSIWLYEHDANGRLASTPKTGIKPTFTRATVRLMAIDQRVVAQVDSSGDGLWDHVLVRNVNLSAKSGPIGIDGYGGALIDDFKLWDGVTMMDPASPTPVPGAEVKFRLRGFPNGPYQAAASFGNTGIVLADGRVIPLTPDPLLFVSATDVLPGLFKSFRGVMNSNGDAKISVALPNLSVLKGLTFFVAFVNYSGASIVTISNDQQVTIQ